MNDRAYCVDDIGGGIDDRGSVACADSESGCSARISSLYHSGTARRKNKVGFTHQNVRKLEARNVDPCDDILGSACLYGCLENELCSSDRRVLRPRMGADDDAVSCFQADERFENCR